MNVNYIALAIPFFFLLIGVEVLYSVWHRKGLYRFNDAVNNLSCGIGEQVLEVFFKSLLAVGYLYLYHHHALLEITPDSAVAWIALFLGLDLCYYWFHRASHEVALIWGSHIVHHQSEEFNLSVALRQDAFQKWFSWVFYLPLAWFGFPPAMFLTIGAFNTLYQFWIHTRAIGRLGPLEWVLNTPSHHRVHHGSDTKYLDRNYAGTLIIWDRLFGSFQVEEEEPHYGITKQLQSWNPLWAQVQYWVELAREVRRMPRLADKLRVLWKPPGWLPEDPHRARFAGPRQFPPKYDARPPLAMNLYVLAQFVPGLLVAVRLLEMGGKGAPFGTLLAMAAFVALTLLCCGALLEGKAWGLKLELSRLLLAAGAVAASAAQGQISPALLTAGLGLTLGSGLWLLKKASDPSGREERERTPSPTNMEASSWNSPTA